MATATRPPHVVLGVPQFATAAELKTAFRRLARTYHPDICHAADAAERFKEVKAAYDALVLVAQRSTGGRVEDPWESAEPAQQTDRQRERQSNRATGEAWRHSWWVSARGNLWREREDGTHVVIFTYKTGWRAGRFGYMVDAVFRNGTWASEREAAAAACTELGLQP